MSLRLPFFSRFPGGDARGRSRLSRVPGLQPAQPSAPGQRLAHGTHGTRGATGGVGPARGAGVGQGGADPPRLSAFGRVLQGGGAEARRARGAIATPKGATGASSSRQRPLTDSADELDAAARQVAHLRSPVPSLPFASPPSGGAPLADRPLPTAAASAPSPAPALASLEDLLPELVRKIAWSGDARRGAVRLEVGAGALAGATVLVRADAGRVHVTLTAPSDGSLEPIASYRDRLAARLAARGLDVADVEVE